MADLSAAAAAMGIPEGLVERSVNARAAESGSSVDELLTAWAGGEAPPPSPASAEPAPSEETPAEKAPEPETRPEPAAPEIVVDVPAPAAPAPVAQGPYKPPILVGAKDRPMTIVAGVIGLFVIIVMVGLVGPSIPIDSPGARSSDIAFSAGALDGRHVYETTGCASCHTQMVRPVVADVGLGPVTLDDTNQVLGIRRFGPDLADVGSRLTASQIEATIDGLGDHPAHDLGSEDMESLVAYLLESSTSSPDEAES
ncbi:MAG: cbb3-type cytochrome c oxidase subunit II [Acidimicrobiia bacterium]